MYQLFPSWDIDDSRILETDRPKDKSGQTPPKKVVLNATFP